MFSVPDILVILAVVLVVFGPGKLPDIGASLGKGIRNFKKATEDEIPAGKTEELEQKPPSSDKTPAPADRQPD